MNINKIITEYKTNTRLKQVVSLFSVNIVGIPLAIITSIIITRYLGPQGYGDYKFIINVFTLAVILGTFGFYHAGNRALVLVDDKQRAREYYGAELVILSGLFIIICIALLLYAIYDNNIQEKGLKTILIYLSPFVWVYLLVRYFEVLFQADNRIKLLAQTRLYPKLGFFISALVLYFILPDFPYSKLLIVFFFFLTTQIVVYIYVLYKVDISFGNLKLRIKEIWNYNKNYGFDVYIGSLFAVGFAQLTGIFISYFGIDNSGVGYYALALTFAAPLSLIPNVIATTHYKDFSKKRKIPGKLVLITVALSIGSLILLWIIVPPFINLFYGKEFTPVIQLNIIVSIGVILHGMADFVNRFLGSHGQGKALRNSSFIVGGSLMIFNIALIPSYGETGAAYTKAITGFVYLLTIVWFYKKYVFSIKDN